MSEMFGGFRSKKTSESGVWVSDQEVKECPLCNRAFSLLVRKHHCRQCGNVICSRCSGTRK
jgi:hypothetical protein